MKLVNVSASFDGSKIVFYFTADGRVDFRELVRDLGPPFPLVSPWGQNNNFCSRFESGR